VPFGSFAVQVSLASLHDPEQSLSVVFSGKQGFTLLGVHTPLALQASAPLQKSPSLQNEVAASFAVQLSVASLQASEQSESLSPRKAAQGSPAWPVQAPELHVSAPVQNRPSLHPVPFGSFAVQLSAASLQDPAQFPSAVFSGRHGFVPLGVHAPDTHESVPLQNVPSLQPVPFGSFAVQLSAPSLHDVAQLASVVLTVHGFVPLGVHTPDTHESVPLQNVPSLQPVAFGSFAVQLSVASLHDPEQSLSAVLSGRHGFTPLGVHTPAAHESVPLQNVPSLHPVPFGSARLHASTASLHEVAQLASVVLTVHGFTPLGVHAPV
jgi:hypothetical protein